MLEIIALWTLTKRIGRIIEEKGRKSGWYKAFTVLLWIGGEIIGAIIGAVITGADESAQCLVYLFALVGAAGGAGIAYLIATNLSPVHSQLQDTSVIEDPVQRIAILKQKFENGEISTQEYEVEKSNILSKM